MSCATPNLSRRFDAAALSTLFVALVFIFGSTPSFAQRPLGTDISHWQGSISATTWTTAKNAGVAFAWTKATEGDYYTDNTIVNHVNGAKNAGVYIGLYHFARPSDNPNITGANSADTEAFYFWNVASNYIKVGGTYLVPMLDWEDDHATNGHNGFNGFTTTLMSQWVNRWCLTVSNLAQTNGVTIRPIVYTGTWFSNPANGYAGLNTTVTNWYSWISSYNGADPQTGGPTASGGKNPTFPWNNWTIWQYDDTNWTGGDSDVLNGIYTNLNPLVIGGLPVPYLVSQPNNHLAADTGGTVGFSCTPGGYAPFKYRWTLNGATIPNRTNSTLVLTNLQTTNAGYYAVVITNAYGAITSSPVSLLVYPQQAVVFADDFDAPSGTNWIYNRSSGDNAVTFYFDYSTNGIPSAPNSVNGSTRGVQMQCNLASGAVAALSLSPTNRTFAGDYRLRFDAWINVNGPLPAGGSGSTEFLTAGVGTLGNRVEWTNNLTADGVYFAIDGEGGINDTQIGLADVNACFNNNILLASSGAYYAGTNVAARGNLADYYVNAFSNNPAPPALQQSKYPTMQTGALADGSFGFAWHDVIVSKRGTTVDWVIDGFRFATVSNVTLSASNVFVGFWDAFSSKSASNTVNFGLIDNVRVESPATSPAFLLQPVAKAARLGTNVTFTAAATSLPVATYQWRFNGTNILGATNANYTLAFVGSTNTGNYSVIATNFMGGVASTNAALVLIAPSAPQFSAAAVTIDGSGAVQVNFSGDAYWTYTIEVSTNLTDWSSLTNLTSATGAFSFTAGSANDAPQQFFRARVGP